MGYNLDTAATGRVANGYRARSLAGEGSHLQLDVSLIERAQDRDERALEQIYDHFFDKIFRYVVVRVGIQADAEDITEEVFLKALTSINSFKFCGAPFSAWLFRIAHNQVIDFHRKTPKRLYVQLDDVEVRDETSLEMVVEQKIAIEHVARAINHLTQAQCQVISLRFGAGLSLAETADVMGKNAGSIKSLQHSGIAALRRVLNIGSSESPAEKTGQR